MSEDRQRHLLKTWPTYFDAVKSGVKTFELRRDDRGYKVGDILDLREYDPGSGWTGRQCIRDVTYVLRSNHAFGLLNGDAIVLGLAQPEPKP